MSVSVIRRLKKTNPAMYDLLERKAAELGLTPDEYIVATMLGREEQEELRREFQSFWDLFESVDWESLDKNAMRAAWTIAMMGAFFHRELAMTYVQALQQTRSVMEQSVYVAPPAPTTVPAGAPPAGAPEVVPPPPPPIEKRSEVPRKAAERLQEIIDKMYERHEQKFWDMLEERLSTLEAEVKTDELTGTLKTLLKTTVDLLTGMMTRMLSSMGLPAPTKPEETGIKVEVVE